MNWKTAWLSLVALLLPLGAAAYDDITIDATLNDSARTITGTVEIRFSDYARGADRYLFRLFPNVSCTGTDTACGLVIDSAWVDGTDVSDRIVATGVYISVPHPNPPVRRDTTIVRLNFTMNMKSPARRTGFQGKRYLLEAWFPIPALWRDSAWKQTVYVEHSEPTADLFDITATLRVPRSLVYMAPSTQLLDSADDTYVWRTVMEGVDDIGAVIGRDFSVDSSLIAGINVSVWYQQDNAWVVPAVRRAIEATFSFMAGEGLPYPYQEKVVVIDGYPSGGLELPRLTAVMSPEGSMPGNDYEFLIIHETVHQWFYGLINNDQADNPMLDESITEYFTVRVMDATYGTNSVLDLAGFTASSELSTRSFFREHIERVPIDRATSAYDDEYEYYFALYYKGAATVRFLCRLMGTDGERQFWQDWVRQYRDRMPSTDDFLILADQCIARRPGLAREIVRSTARTDLAVIDVKTAIADDTALTAAADSTSPTPRFKSTVDFILQNHFDLPVTMRLWFTDGSTRDTTITDITGQHQLTLHSDVPMHAAALDPEHIFATDINYLNNGITVDRTGSAALRLFSGVTFLIQSLLSMLWGW